MEEVTSKTCKMCYKEMDSRAKKCPYCQHWQSKFSKIVWHPAFAVFLIMGFIVVFGVIFESLFVFDKGEDFAPYRNQITIRKSELKFGETSHGPTVVVMGEIKNNSNLSWKDVQLEVRFYDNNNKLIDTDQKNKYSFVIPANDISTFKVSIPREFPEEQYANCKVRILSAKDARTMW
ncbi:MAG: FxLYD domain-containing protein [Planctomycetota bacterium]|jgi:hypothetical protein